MKTVVVLAVACASMALAQAPVASLKQMMLDLLHPASNELLLFVYRGGPENDAEWAAARRSALTLAESASLLMLRERAVDQGEWMTDAKLLADAGAAAYKAAQAQDSAALAAAAASLDASCTTCHRKYRPDVFPPQRGSQ